MPGKLFWKWSLYAVLKSLFTGVFLGSLWMVATAVEFQQGTVLGNLGYMLSFLVDGTFVYWAVLLGASQGFILQTWDVFGALLTDARRMFLTRYLVAVLASLVAGFILRFIWMQIGTATEGQVPAFYAMIVSFTVVASIAYATSFRGFMMYVVMDSKRRREYIREDNSRGGVTRMMRSMIPWMDRNRMAFTVLQVVFMVAISIQVAVTLSSLYGEINLFPVTAAVGLSLTPCLWAWLLRLWDSLRPGKRRETLYPHFEDYR